MNDPSVEVLRTLFTEQVLARLRAAPPTDSLVYRVAAITLTQPRGLYVPWLEAQRLAWSSYLVAASDCGLLVGRFGRDLTARLTHVDDEQFRSAMAECQAAWYLREKLGLAVSARPPGKGASELELLVKLPEGDILVEVKSPLRVAIADGAAHALDDSDILDRCLADASKQLRKGTRNLVMLVGRLTLGIHVRQFFVKAFYGAEKLLISRETRASRIEFDLNGRFLKVWPGEDGPRHTRVGGVLFVQENIRSSIGADGDHVHRTDNDSLMLHNPNAIHPLPEGPWRECPQLVLRGEVMEWTDGHPVGGPVPNRQSDGD
ncbi:MAG: hypothetical protein HOP12_09720 [Candidatus Eisenbacteria bacterium]|uniref:Uncharacterized protein n=1 Tax=Eiseniibacteriota bacterium TaxID=2212470 RepID=A0A849SP70_UNCEI|nr:hypothetical protein [Candidatus Eisenbacteria bacterium]